MKSIYLSILIVALLLSGCAEALLQSRKESVTTESISTSVFKVTFCGNAYMTKKEAEIYAMQRACELALKKGFTHFEVLDKSDQSDYCLLSDLPRQTYPGATEKSFVGPQNVVRPNMSLRIQCYKQKDAPQDAIDAQKYLDENFPGLEFEKSGS